MRRAFHFLVVYLALCSCRVFAHIGPAGGALDFNGTNNYVTASLGSPPVNNYTISAWVYLRTGGSFFGTRVAVLGGTGCGDSIELLIRSETSDPTDTQYLELGRCDFFNGNSSTVAIPLNTWTHVAVTVSSGNVVSYYINGNPAGTWSGPGMDLSLGSTINLGDNNGIRVFDGDLDEVRIYNRVLSQTEIQETMGAILGGSEPGLYAYYRFDEGSGTTTADSATMAGGSAGTLVNAPLWVVSGVSPFGSAYFLATNHLVVGPGAGTNSIVLGTTNPFVSWSATTNSFWLHLDAANRGGPGGTNVVFSFDSNPGPTRVGLLTIAGLTLTITQAGSTYVAAIPLTTLVPSGLNQPGGLAVDRAGNVYIADTYNNAIEEWSAASGMMATLVSTGLAHPTSVAVDPAGNVYISDSQNNAVKEWVAASNTVVTLVSSADVARPGQIALDGAGNVYIADTGDSAVKEWVAASNHVITLVSTGLYLPQGLAVDAAGNVYFANTQLNMVEEWLAASGTIITNAFVNLPGDLAVDPSGNVYVVDSGSLVVRELSAATGTFTTVYSANLSYPSGLAVDTSGNVYVDDSVNDFLKELPRAFVNTAPKLEGAAAGADSLLVVLPDVENLAGPFVPNSDSPWLTINNATNGDVNISFTATASPREGHLNVLGQSIPIIQGNIAYALGTTNMVVGPSAGTGSVVLGVTSLLGPWTASAGASWLHLSPAPLNGSGSTNVIFTFDTNPGPTRTGTLTIAGMTVTVTQAGATYLPMNHYATLFSTGVAAPESVAVDFAGNVCFPTADDVIERWSPTSNTLTSLVSTGLNIPSGIAVDSGGNVYIADTFNNEIKVWWAASNHVTTLVSTGLDNPEGVAVDSAGNVYIADTFNNAVKEWLAASNSVSPLVTSGLSLPYGVAVDAAGNVYIADSDNNEIEEWSAATGTVTPLVSSGLSFPRGVAVDGSGNVYIADTDHSAIWEWSATSQTVAHIANTPGPYPQGVAVDGSGNYYIADSGNNSIDEVVRAFAVPTPIAEPPTAGSDTLPPVLPANVNLTGPLAPGSDSPWLTITGVTNGVVSFSFTGTTSNRTANISVLSLAIAITQTIPITPPVLADVHLSGGGTFSFTFTNGSSPNFVVVTSTNLSLPLTHWTVLGPLTNDGTGVFNFSTTVKTNEPERFYRVSWPGPPGGT